MDNMWLYSLYFIVKIVWLSAYFKLLSSTYIEDEHSKTIFVHRDIVVNNSHNCVKLTGEDLSFVAKF